MLMTKHFINKLLRIWRYMMVATSRDYCKEVNSRECRGRKVAVKALSTMTKKRNLNQNMMTKNIHLGRARRE